jgi:hypothetical protein
MFGLTAKEKAKNKYEEEQKVRRHDPNFTCSLKDTDFLLWYGIIGINLTQENVGGHGLRSRTVTAEAHPQNTGGNSGLRSRTAPPLGSRPVTGDGLRHRTARPSAISPTDANDSGGFCP